MALMHFCGIDTNIGILPKEKAASEEAAKSTGSEFYQADQGAISGMLTGTNSPARTRAEREDGASTTS